MDKKKIHDFAVSARRNLISSIKLRLAQVGITEKGATDKLPNSTAEIEFYVANEQQGAGQGISGKDIARRTALVNRLTQAAEKGDWVTAYKNLVEEAAYTWFNRIIAIRFMEVNHYLPSRVAVLSSEEGHAEPDILVHALEIEDDLGSFTDEQRQLIEKAQDTQDPKTMDKAYRMLFLKQANALNANLPLLFEKTSDAFQLLFTPSYQNGVIKELVTEVPRDDFDVEKTGQVEIIGWLYQYYNEEARERAIGQPKSHKYSEPELASATQLFTPDWIVKYMVQNSLGKLWIHSLMAKGKGTEQDLVQKFDWQYYMPDATQNESKSQLIAATDKPLTSLVPKDIQFLDPSMGSGHILVYAFDVLMQIYLSEGYGRREAAQAVLQNNLVGLDIDSRATQLSYFAVMMKLRQFDRRALSQSEHCSPKLYTVVSSQDIPRANVQLLLAHATANEKEAVTNLLQGFAHADEYGSLTDVSSIDLALLKSAQQKVNVNQATLHTDFVRVKLSQLVQIAQILKAKFDVIVTNPPYMGTARLDTDYSAYVKKHFPRAKADLFAMFIEKFNAALKKGGYSALVTMQSWMFLSSFEKMRKHLLAHYTISNLMHMENGVMGIAFGTAVLVTRNVQSKEFVGTYHQIKSGDARMGDPQSLPIPGNRFNRTNQTNYMKIPGMRIAYWAPEHLINAFIDSRTLGSYYPIQSGMKTANNDLFTRKWWEVKFPRICFFRKSINEQSNGKWFPYNKGGYFRRWYGNRELIVNFAENGSQIQKYGEENSKSYSFQGAQHYFQEGITWTGKTSSINSFRHSPFGAIFDSNAGPMVFPGNESEERTLLGMLNSHVSAYILNMYNPTINLQNGDVGDLPIVRMDDSRAVPIVDYNIQITKNDWDDSEASWDLNKYILLTHIAEHNRNWTVEAAFNQWKQEAQDRFDQLKKNEEELNRIFIGLYGLQDELSPEESDKEVSVRRADLGRDIRAFMSYFIGVTFGRYSLDTPGLAFAGGDWDASKYTTYQPNKDDVIILTDDDYFGDERDIMYRFKEFLTTTFGKEHLEENLTFIANALGKAGDSAEEQIRNYLFNDFYKNHTTIYQKRPIYWELNSGRQGGFRALMYLHRYDPDTMAMIRTSYLHDLQAAYEKRIANLSTFIDTETNTKQKNKMIKQRDHVRKQLDELVKYDVQLQHIANMHIALDLDDGVVVNHKKVQADAKLLAPIK